MNFLENPRVLLYFKILGRPLHIHILFALQMLILFKTFIDMTYASVDNDKWVMISGFCMTIGLQLIFSLVKAVKVADWKDDALYSLKTIFLLVLTYVVILAVSSALVLFFDTTLGIFLNAIETTIYVTIQLAVILSGTYGLLIDVTINNFFTYDFYRAGGRNYPYEYLPYYEKPSPFSIII